MEHILLNQFLEYFVEKVVPSSNSTSSRSFPLATSADMKSTLTENGVFKLYSTNNLRPKLQVLFLFHWRNHFFVRLSDGKHISPVILVQKKKKMFDVGSVILVRQAHWVLSVEANSGLYPVLDTEVGYISIREFKVEIPKSEIIGSLNKEIYWNSIMALKNGYIKSHASMDLTLHIETWRLYSLQNWCNLLRERGNEFFKNSEYTHAICHYEMAKEKDQFDYKVWSNCSQAYYKNEQFTEAEEDAMIAIKLNLFNTKAYYRFGQAAIQLEKFEIACDVVRAGIYICGENEDLLKLLKVIEGKTDTTISPTKDIGEYNDDLAEKELLQLLEIKKKLEETQKGNESLIESLKSDLETNDKATEMPSPLFASLSADEKKSVSMILMSLDGTVSALFLESPKTGNVSEENGYKISRAIYHDNLVSIMKFVKAYDNEDDKLNEKYIDFIADLKKCGFLILNDIKNNKFKNTVPIFVIECFSYIYSSDTTQEKLIWAFDKIYSLTNNYSIESDAIIYYYLCIILNLKLKKYGLINSFVRTILRISQNCDTIATKVWPILNKPVLNTSREFILNFIQKRSWQVSGVPSSIIAKCSAIQCDHPWKGLGCVEKDISVLDPDFLGYMKVECEKLCSFSFHTDCLMVDELLDLFATDEYWSESEVRQIVGRVCYNKTSCDGVIVKVQFFGEDLLLRQSFIFGKEAKPDPPPTQTKSKKKKDKKKEKASSNANKEKNNNTNIVIENKGNNTSDDKKKETPVNNKSEDNKNGKSSMVNNSSNNNSTEKSDEKLAKATEDKKDKKSSNQKSDDNKKSKNPNSENNSIEPTPEPEVFKPFEYSSEVTLFDTKERQDEESSITSNKKSKKKKKKKNNNNNNNINVNSNTASAPNITVSTQLNSSNFENNESNSSQCAYLDLLKQKKNKDLSEKDDLSSSISSLPFGFEQENDFFLPPHLQSNSDQLEYILSTKSFENFKIHKDSILTLLDFMYDWLQTKGPMNKNDTQLNEYVNDNFPNEAVTYVNSLGGVQGFLLLSPKFAQVDDYICTKDQIEDAQDHVIKLAVEKFKSSKYMISDGFKAQKIVQHNNDAKMTSFSSYSLTKIPPQEASYLTATSSTPIKPKKTIHRLDSFEKSDLLSDNTSSIATLTDLCYNQSKSLGAHLKESSFNSLDDFGLTKAEDIQIQVESALKYNTLAKDSRNTSFSFASECGDVFNSDEEIGEENVNSFDPSVNATSDLKDEIKTLREQLKKSHAANEVFSGKNNELNDRLTQFKMKSSTEIDLLKKKLEETIHSKENAETNLDWFKTQQETDMRKIVSEKQNLMEELQNQNLKLDEAMKTIKNLQDQINVKNVSLNELQGTHSYIEQSHASALTRAQEAEFKYLSMKNEIVTQYLKQVGKKLSFEAGKLRQLIPQASEDTLPKKSALIQVIKEWALNLDHINATIVKFETESKKLLSLVSAGKPLNTLTDISSPTIQDFSLIDLVEIGQKRMPAPIAPSVNPQLGLHTSSASSNTLGLDSLRDSIFGNVLSNPYLQLGGRAPHDASPSFNLNGTSPASSFTNLSSVPPTIKSSHLIGAIGPNMKPNSSSSSPAPSLSNSSSSIASNAGAMDNPNKDEQSSLLPSSPFYGHTLGVNPRDKALGNVPTSGQKTAPSLLNFGSLANKEPNSAYGLGGITANAAVATKPTERTLPTPSTTTVTKPKFQNLRINDVGAIGTRPPKLIRPQAKQGSSCGSPLLSSSGGNNGASLMGRDTESVSRSTSYQKLIDDCKNRFGSEYPLPAINDAIRKVREANKNSLSGLSVDVILERVSLQLKRQPHLGKPSIAPWANMGQASKGRQNFDGVGDDQCPICLEQLADNNNKHVLPCKHAYHTDCIKPWLKQKSDCPVCRNFTLMNDEYPSLTHP